MEHFVLYNNQNTRKYIKYKDWLIINENYINNIIITILDELYKNRKEYNYEIN